MTVTNLNDRDSSIADGVQTEFPYSFRATDPAQVKVFFDGVPMLSGFSVRRNPSGTGGKVVFTSPPANGKEVLRLRQAEQLQETEFGVNDSLNPEILEDSLDLLTILVQQNKASFEAALKLPTNVSPDSVNTELPPVVPGYLLGWNLEGDGLRTVSPFEAFNDFAPEGGGLGGDVIGPASSTNGALAVFSSTSGKAIAAGPAPGPNGHLLQSQGGAWVAAAPAETSDVVVPSGTLGFYFDESHIPAGYALCNGQTVTVNGAPFVTPDTRGKYLLCAAVDDTSSTGYTGSSVRPGQIAGAKNHAHTQQGTVSTQASNPGTNTSIERGTGTLVAAKGPGSLQHAHNVNLSGNTTGMADADRPIGVAILVAIKVDE